MFNPQHIRPPHYLLALLSLAAVLQFILQPAQLIPYPYNWLGVPVFAAGFFIMTTGYKNFVKKDTPIRHSETPKALVTEGLFQYTRNPMYVGIELFLAGIGLLINTWPFLLVPVVMFFILQYVFIPWEEKLMEDLFKDEYRAYRQKVRRWLPWIGGP